MTNIQENFQRKEIKYILTQEVFQALKEDLAAYMIPDKFAQSTISNIYFDSPNYQMIIDSLNRRYGGEKIRMRTYDPKPSDLSQVFLEIKRKEGQDEDAIGYKYRLYAQAPAILNYVKHQKKEKSLTDKAQVHDQLSKLRQRYQKLQPMMYIHYDRLSFRGIEDAKLRLTVDQDVVYRTYDLDLKAGFYGEKLLDDGKVIMEVKIKDKLPDWMLELFDKYGLTSQPFSKYTTAYLKAHHLTPEMVRGEVSQIA